MWVESWLFWAKSFGPKLIFFYKMGLFFYKQVSALKGRIETPGLTSEVYFSGEAAWSDWTWTGQKGPSSPFKCLKI